MRELLITFVVLIAAPIFIGLFPARFLSGQETCFAAIWLTKGKGIRHAATRPSKARSVCPAAVYLAGFLTELAVFQLIAVPIIVLEAWGFPRIVWFYSIALAVLSMVGLIVGYPVLRGWIADAGVIVCRLKRKSTADIMEETRQNISKAELAETVLYWLLAAALLIFQLYMAFTRSFFDGDDAYYVVQSVIAEETNVLYRILPYTGLTTAVDIRHGLASLPIWEAYVARVSGTHAAVMAHSILPLVIIPATYLLFFRIGMRLFNGNGRKTAMFLILVGLLQIFGNTSIYTNATFLLMRTWQGKSMLCNLILLAEIWILLNLNEMKKQDRFDGLGWWFLLGVNHIAAAMMTTMGAFLIGLFAAIVGLVWAVREKRPKILVFLAVSCIPCLIYLALYVLLA